MDADEPRADEVRTDTKDVAKEEAREAVGSTDREDPRCLGAGARQDRGATGLQRARRLRRVAGLARRRVQLRP